MSGSPANVAPSRWLSVHAMVVFAFLYLPIAVLILYSFNGPGVGGFPPHHLTLDWYRADLELQRGGTPAVANLAS